MMGYANPAQTATGLHGRLFARSFYISQCANPGFIYVTIDNGMCSVALKRNVIKRLNEHGLNFDDEHVMISGTHTHSGPAGYFDFFLYQVTSLGHIEEVLETMTNGVVDSILKARNNRIKQEVHFGIGRVYNASINRSPSSYLMNPSHLLDYYESEGNTDTNLTMLIFGTETKLTAQFNWFPVHPTAMNNSNTLINGDSKGWAQEMLESSIGNDFIAGFGSTNLGDISPNILGPACRYGGNPPRGHYDGEPCDFTHGTCTDNALGATSVSKCIAYGPGLGPSSVNGIDIIQTEFNDKDTTDIIAKRQFHEALKLIQQQDFDEISGDVQFKHRHVNMATWSGKSRDGKQLTGCKPAMGVSFAAGTTDGPGYVEHGMNWDYMNSNYEGEDWIGFKVRDFLMNIIATDPVNTTEYDCHKSRPVLLPTGWADRPYAWHPSVIELGIYRIGTFYILSVPGEFSTMAGRILRENIRSIIRTYSPESGIVFTLKHIGYII